MLDAELSMPVAVRVASKHSAAAGFAWNRHATLPTWFDLAAFFTNRCCDRMADIAADANKKKYDRQLRIWGAHGQASLESARVCLLNAGPTGSETLKNLVLGGIAAFTVVDDCKVFCLVASPPSS